MEDAKQKFLEDVTAFISDLAAWYPDASTFVIVDADQGRSIPEWVAVNRTLPIVEVLHDKDASEIVLFVEGFFLPPKGISPGLPLPESRSPLKLATLADAFHELSKFFNTSELVIAQQFVATEKVNISRIDHPIYHFSLSSEPSSESVNFQIGL